MEKAEFKGTRKYFDPVYYDESGHLEIKKAIEILKSWKK